MRVLILEENQSEIKLIESILNDSGYVFESKSAKTESEFVKFVNRYKPDVIISGATLSKYSVYDALDFLKEQELLIPFILITGNISETSEKDYLRRGVDEYLTKFNLLSLPAVIIKSIEIKKTLREKVAAEIQAKNNEAKLNSFYNNNPESIFELGFGCEVINLNISAKEMLDHQPHSKSKKIKFTDFLYPEEIKIFKEAHAQVCRGQKRNLTLRIKNSKDDIWLDCKIIPVLDAEKNVASVLIVAIDISGKIKSEKALSRSQHDFQALISAIDDSLWSVDKELRLDIFNEMADRFYRKICGRPLKKGMTLHSFAGSTEREKFWRVKLEKVFKGEKINFIDKMEIEKVECYFSLTVYPIIFENEIIGATIVSHEITPYVLAEEKLKRSESKFRTLAESAPVGIFKLDQKGNCLYCNQNLLSLLGANNDEMSGKGWHSYISSDYLNTVKREWAKCANSRTDYSETIRLEKKSGEKIWVNLKTTLLDKNSSQSESIYLGTVADVNYLKEANDALKQKQFVFDSVEGTDKIGFWTRSIRENDHAAWSDSNYTIFDRPKEKGPLSFSDLIDIIHPDDRDAFIRGIENLKMGDVMNVEFRIITSSNTLKHLVTTAHPLRDESGRVIKIAGSTHDISKLREKELESQSRNALLQKTFDLIKIGTWDYDLISERYTWSKEFKKMAGLNENESTPSKEVFCAMVHPSDRETIRRNLESKGNDHEVSTYEYSIFVKGEFKTILTISHPVQNNNGEIIKLNGLAIDISKTKRTEQKLKATEELFNTFFENVPDAVFIESEDGIILNANKNACELKGLKRADLIGKNFLEYIPAPYHAAEIKNFKKLFSGETKLIQCKTWNISGKEFPVEIKASKVLYKNQPALLLNMRSF